MRNSIGPFALVLIWLIFAGELTNAQEPTSSVAGKSKAVDAYNRGVQYFNKRDYKSAVAAFSESINSDPAFADAWYNRAVAKDLLGDNDGAMLDANEAFRLKPESVNALELRARSKERSGDLQGAFDDLNLVLDKDAARAEALNDRALVRYKLGDREGALADLGAAIKLRPERQDFKRNRETVVNNVPITSETIGTGQPIQSTGAAQRKPRHK